MRIEKNRFKKEMLKLMFFFWFLDKIALTGFDKFDSHLIIDKTPSAS